jgi:Xaa-Pro dipeptidase
MLMALQRRLDQFRDRLKARKLEAALLTLPTTLKYLTGFHSDPMERFLGLWVPVEGETVLFVPELDAAKAQKAAGISRLLSLADGESPYTVLLRECGKGPLRCGVEKKALSWHIGEQLALMWPGTDFQDVGGELQALRGRKTREEADKAAKAAKIADDAIGAALESFRLGMSEREMAEEIDRQIRIYGGAGPAFTTTVLAGARSALPHGETSDTPISDGDFLLIDMGARFDDYLSDMTRTFLVGKGTHEQERIYETVREASKRAVAAVRLGTPLYKVDEAARAWITDQGYGQLFIHRVGHGLGLDIHEEPSIHGRNRDLIAPGMLFTIEPGIYMPGIGGVRIEDDIYVNESGEVEQLTCFPSELRRL